ncbi:MAG: hypothetical protein Q4C30_03655 [Bacteroidia bacterium]|nr:hypothetical protein [Bacteroidia bacterium]
MKKTILSAVAILLSVLNAFAENNNDTTIVYNGMNIHLSASDASSVNVNITKANSTVYTAVYEEKSDSASAKTTYHISEDIPLLNLLNKNNKQRSSFNHHMSGFSVGFNSPMNTVNDCPDNNVARSINITFIPFEKAWGFTKNFGLGIGLGFEWENYRLTDDEFFKYENGSLNLVDVKEAFNNPNASVDESKLRTFGFIMPIMLEINRGKYNSPFISMGIVLNVVPTSHYYSKVSVDDQIMKYKTRGLHHNVFGCDLMAQLGCKKVGIFARYSMTELFKSDHGPKMNTLTVGLSWYFHF